MSLTRAQLLAEILADLPSGTAGAITAAILRGVLNDIVNNVWTLQDANTLAGALSLPAGSIWSGLDGILVGNGSSPVTALVAGQIPGTATNDSASAGNIGEFITASLSNVALTTATAANICSITLTAGDWDVWGEVYFNPAGATTITAIAAGTATTSTVLPTAPGGGLVQIAATMTTGTPQALPVGVERYSLGGSTTIYLVALSDFGTSTMQANGKISARRAR